MIIIIIMIMIMTMTIIAMIMMIMRWSSLRVLLIWRAMLAGAQAPGRVTHARQVKGEKPDKYSEANLEMVSP